MGGCGWVWGGVGECGGVWGSVGECGSLWVIKYMCTSEEGDKQWCGQIVASRKLCLQE